MNDNSLATNKVPKIESRLSRAPEIGSRSPPGNSNVNFMFANMLIKKAMIIQYENSFNINKQIIQMRNID